jgi:hypothetical protein
MKKNINLNDNDMGVYIKDKEFARIHEEWSENILYEIHVHS